MYKDMSLTAGQIGWHNHDVIVQWRSNKSTVQIIVVLYSCSPPQEGRSRAAGGCVCVGWGGMEGAFSLSASRAEVASSSSKILRNDAIPSGIDPTLSLPMARFWNICMWDTAVQGYRPGSPCPSLGPAAVLSDQTLSHPRDCRRPALPRPRNSPLRASGTSCFPPSP